ncbi:MAG: aspartyl/glutamyl-tRNA(Asn/Gln) amidotransferase subunit B [Pirellulaceae bacterium]|nr:MAG: aspartyl/glutamyl-tRNA(Asn/Gln) amidotransferase subunit B [Pirellulaceae bacterium]
MSQAVPYTIVIGLEVHVQLLTRTKLFCRCPTTFGAPPNTQTCPVCLGLPGALPVMNRRAFELALRTAVALQCRIPPRTKWDRKNYFYPDLPKGYQISQYDLPLATNGYLEIADPAGRFAPKPIRIRRAHLEEDAGKSLHDEAAGVADSRIDLNRAGTPLLEIVTEPDIRSPLEAKTFLSELKLLLLYLEVSDCNMQEGSLRVDANINIHIPTASGMVATPIVEVKNMNSFRAVERALQYEAERQYVEWQATGLTKENAPKQTRGWDDQAEVTVAQRRKEESSDYRYFPDPDLAEVTIPAHQIERLRDEMGELPGALRKRLEQQYGLDAYASDVLVNQGKAVVAYFEQVARQCGDARRAANWIQQDVLRVLNERHIGIEQYPVAADELAELLRQVGDGQLITSRAREVLERMVQRGEKLEQAIAALGIQSVSSNQLRELCRQLVEANPRIAADVRAGKRQAVGALVGQAKKRNPNVNPAEVQRICLELIEQSE